MKIAIIFASVWKFQHSKSVPFTMHKGKPFVFYLNLKIEVNFNKLFFKDRIFMRFK